MSDFIPDGTRRPRRKPGDAPEAMPLFDHVETPKETRKAAFNASKAKANERDKLVLKFIRGRGAHGATMYEVSVEAGVLYQSASSVFKRLKKASLIRHNGKKRPTQTGALAAVVVAVGGPDE